MTRRATSGEQPQRGRRAAVEPSATAADPDGAEAAGRGFTFHEALRSSDEGRASRNRGIILARQIEREIVESGWPVGKVLGSEDELLSRYGVGRPVLRQAVRLLEHQSVAAMRRGPGGGLVVVEPDADLVTEAIALYLQYREVSPRFVFDARTALELACVQTATEQLTEAGIAQLREMLDGEAAATVADVVVHAQDFHAAVAGLTGNDAMQLFVRSLGRLTRERTRLPDNPEQQANDVRVAHRRIAEAMIAGDVGLARHRMLRHLQGIASYLH
jgi:DNA-binding FadR family transcriptional regulator